MKVCLKEAYKATENSIWANFMYYLPVQMGKWQSWCQAFKPRGWMNEQLVWNWKVNSVKFPDWMRVILNLIVYHPYNLNWSYKYYDFSDCHEFFNVSHGFHCYSKSSKWIIYIYQTPYVKFPSLSMLNQNVAWLVN